MPPRESSRRCPRVRDRRCLSVRTHAPLDDASPLHHASQDDALCYRQVNKERTPVGAAKRIPFAVIQVRATGWRGVQHNRCTWHCPMDPSLPCPPPPMVSSALCACLAHACCHTHTHARVRDVAAQLSLPSSLPPSRSLAPRHMPLPRPPYAARGPSHPAPSADGASGCIPHAVRRPFRRCPVCDQMREALVHFPHRERGVTRAVDSESIAARRMLGVDGGVPPHSAWQMSGRSPHHINSALLAHHQCPISASFIRAQTWGDAGMRVVGHCPRARLSRRSWVFGCAISSPRDGSPRHGHTVDAYTAAMRQQFVCASARLRDEQQSAARECRERAELRPARATRASQRRPPHPPSNAPSSDAPHDVHSSPHASHAATCMSRYLRR